MLYYKFRNFGEFQELFGIQHHASGEKSRKNRILLSYIKNRRLLHNAVASDDYSLLHISDMAELKKTMHHEIRSSGHNDDSLLYEIKIKMIFTIAHSIIPMPTMDCVKTVTFVLYVTSMQRTVESLR